MTRTRFQGQNVKGQLAESEDILWRPPAQLAFIMFTCLCFRFLRLYSCIDVPLACLKLLLKKNLLHSVWQILWSVLSTFSLRLSLICIKVLYWSSTDSAHLILCAHFILFTYFCYRFHCLYSCIDVQLTHLMNITQEKTNIKYSL